MLAPEDNSLPVSTGIILQFLAVNPLGKRISNQVSSLSWYCSLNPIRLSKLDKLVKIERFDNNTFGVSNLTGFGIALICGNFCILAISASIDASSDTEINLKLPYKFQNAYAHVTDNDKDLINRTVDVGWASNTLKYKNVLSGHTILIVGQISS